LDQNLRDHEPRRRLAAADAGANALGFVFYPTEPAPRHDGNAKSIIAKLPQSLDIEKVGVFVDATVEQVR
jgi:phosphoribosylanthranilate isomerase